MTVKTYGQNGSSPFCVVYVLAKIYIDFQSTWTNNSTKKLDVNKETERACVYIEIETSHNTREIDT